MGSGSPAGYDETIENNQKGSRLKFFDWEQITNYSSYRLPESDL